MRNSHGNFILPELCKPCLFLCSIQFAQLILHYPKPKTLDQLRAEKERAETQLAQEQHKLERLENRKKYLEKGERTKRTHRLCNLGGTIESLAPEVKDLTRTEMTELMEHIFSLSEVQRAVRHMAITHISQANREKELKADGTISSERHAD